MGTPPDPLMPLRDRTSMLRPFVRNAREREIFDRVLAGVDADRHAELQRKYREATIANAHDRTREFKFLDLAFSAWRASQRVGRLGLFDAPPSQILDLGSGSGVFAAICSALGHTVLGVDRPDTELFGELHELLGVKRVVHLIRPADYVPSALGRHDLITAAGVNFDRLPSADGSLRLWTVPEWFGLFDTLSANHLERPGRIQIELNKWPPDPSRFFPSLLDACRRRGAAVEPQAGRIVFDFPDTA